MKTGEKLYNINEVTQSATIGVMEYWNIVKGRKFHYSITPIFRKLSNIIILFAAFQLIFSLKTFSQDLKTPPAVEKNADDNRTVLDLMKLITNRQIQKNKLRNGEYKKGNWEAVKHSILPKTMYWSYPAGVTLLAMQRVYSITKDKKILSFVNKNNRISADQYAYLLWQKMKFGTVYKTAGFGKLWRLSSLDDCGAMGAEILESKLRHHVKYTSHLKKLVEIIGNYVTNIQDRLPDGTLWRPHSHAGPTIWADDLYMSLPFLIRWSEYKKSTASLNDAARQIINYASYLQDKDGVWFHGYYVDKKMHSCCKWGRANGWAAVAIAEVLSVLPKSNPYYNKVLTIFKKQIDGLIKYQSKSGLWYEVIDHPELTWGTETSCSAEFAYAIARGINKGWLDKSYIPVVEKIFKGLKTRIDKEGAITGVCSSTNLENDLEYYNKRPSEFDDQHGNGLVLLALTEIYKMQNNFNTKKFPGVLNER